ncbi:MAG: GNAT family N-acetyltransferase [Bacteroidia bacterium]|nr:GNAT family N-acetyltransferase [Bacteroidia bacterium]
MNEVISFHHATEKDIEIVLSTIIQADKSGTEYFSFHTCFGLTEQRFREIMREILLEDVGGQEWNISDYIVVKVDGNTAGALCSWIEGSGNQSSSMIRGTLMQHFFPPEALKQAKVNKHLIDELFIEKIPGHLILEAGYIVPEYRSRGLLAKLMVESMRIRKAQHPHLVTCSINVLRSNAFAIRIYEKIGFVTEDEKFCENPEILKLIASKSRVLMRRSLDNLN